MDLKRLVLRLVLGKGALPPDDIACLAAAERIGQDRPQWLVEWGTQSRLFWAYPKFALRQDQMVSASSPDELIAGMDRNERLWCLQHGADEVQRVFGNRRAANRPRPAP